MEPFLIAMTVLSLAMAALMSVIAWKLLRDKKDRSAARVEALEAMAFDGLATRLASRDEDEMDVEAGFDGEPSPADLFRRDREDPGIGAAAPDALFEAPAILGAGRRRFLAFAAVAVVGIAGVGTTYALRTPGLDASTGASSEAAPLSTPAETGGSRSALSQAPLELLSLRHAVGRDGTFTVTGLAQNPTQGQGLNGVEAVVYLFDGGGQYFATGRAALGAGRLDPGEETPFVITVAGAPGVSRYRVGFRREDGGVVAHVDHRGQPPQETTGAAADGAEVPGGPSPASTPRRSEG
jgi:hypothetical protein